MGFDSVKPRYLLQSLWDSQQLYNRRVRNTQTPEGIDSQAYWNKQYLLGLTSEIGETLQNLDWKPHRRQPVLANRRNLGLELSDLTKYVLSLWEHNGFTLTDMLYYIGEKTKMIEEQYQMDFQPIPNKPVVIADIDGTLGDYRKGFLDWVREEHGLLEDQVDRAASLLFDTDMNMPYPTYYDLKEEFEAEGGYGWLPPYLDGIDFLQQLRDRVSYSLVVYTARPAGRYKYIWLDTLNWLHRYGLNPVQLHIGGAERVLLAYALSHTYPVLLLEDNPDLIKRASNASLPVLARRHQYNTGLDGLPQVQMVTDFSQYLDWAEEVLQWT